MIISNGTGPEVGEKKTSCKPGCGAPFVYLTIFFIIIIVIDVWSKDHRFKQLVNTRAETIKIQKVINTFSSRPAQTVIKK